MSRFFSVGFQLIGRDFLSAQEFRSVAIETELEHQTVTDTELQKDQVTIVKKIKFGDSETEDSQYDEKDICDEDKLDDVDPTSTENICSVCGEFG
ncbi:hypothetical protein FQA39_LY05982 [Lamprigera yunnana]|nr:hypothetical protein FQA39_LY05982 [Lamprigera yunnana]